MKALILAAVAALSACSFVSPPPPTPTPISAQLKGATDSLCSHFNTPCSTVKVVAGPFESTLNEAPALIYFVYTTHESDGGVKHWGWVMYVNPADGSFLGAD